MARNLHGLTPPVLAAFMSNSRVGSSADWGVFQSALVHMCSLWFLWMLVIPTVCYP